MPHITFTFTRSDVNFLISHVYDRLRRLRRLRGSSKKDGARLLLPSPPSPPTNGPNNEDVTSAKSNEGDDESKGEPKKKEKSIRQIKKEKHEERLNLAREASKLESAKKALNYVSKTSLITNIAHSIVLQCARRLAIDFSTFVRQYHLQSVQFIENIYQQEYSGGNTSRRLYVIIISRLHDRFQLLDYPLMDQAELAYQSDEFVPLGSGLAAVQYLSEDVGVKFGDLVGIGLGQHRRPFLVAGDAAAIPRGFAMLQRQLEEGRAVGLDERLALLDRQNGVPDLATGPGLHRSHVGIAAVGKIKQDFPNLEVHTTYCEHNSPKFERELHHRGISYPEIFEYLPVSIFLPNPSTSIHFHAEFAKDSSHRQHWEVYADNLYSDHFPVITTLQLKFQRVSPFFSHKLNLKKTNWKTYYNRLQDFLIKNEHIFQDMDDKKLYASITQAMKIATQSHKSIDNINLKLTSLIDSNPNSHSQHTQENTISSNQQRNPTKNFKSSSSPWWNEECTSLAAERRSLAKKFLSDPTPENLKLLKINEKSTKKKFAEIKKASFQKYIESKLSKDTDMSEIWKTINKFKGKHINNNNIKDLDTLANARKFIQKYCAHTPLEPPNFQENSSRASNVTEYIDAQISLEEFTAAINSSSKNSSPGIDQVTYSMLKQAPPILIRLLLKSINNHLDKYQIPKDWKSSLVILIPKNSNNKFRPITLASCILKTTEKVLNARLLHYVEKHNILPDSQYGFRKNRSCSLALTKLVTYIYSAFNKDSHVICVSLDIKSAFDNIVPTYLLKILNEIGIPLKLKKFIYNITENRKLFFKLANGFEGPYTKNIGTPQGNVLSPTLYNLYILELSKTIESPIQLLQYADDTLVLLETDDITEGINIIEKALKKINTYFQNIHLTLSAEKTQFIIFSKTNTNINTQPTINFNDSTIKPSKVIKYLGLHLDNQLDWTAHYNSIIKKATKQLNILRALRATWWGGHPQTLLIVYKALIRSTMEYNLFLTSTTNKLTEKIQKIQNQGIRLSVGYRVSTALNVIHGETHTPYIQTRISHLANNFILKSLSSENHTIISDIRDLINSLNEKDVHKIKVQLPILKAYTNRVKFNSMVLSTQTVNGGNKMEKHNNKSEQELSITTEDVVYEEEIVRNPYSVKHWQRYIEHLTASKSLNLNVVYERALKELPGSYKLWYAYLQHRLKRLKGRRIDDPMYEQLNHIFERALVFMHKMPRIWMDYCQFMTEQDLVKRTRHIFDRALRALPLTQHHRIWPLYLTFVKKYNIPETAIRIFRRYLKLAPEEAEEYIDYLISIGKLDEAAVKLAEVVNADEFVSKHGKSKHQLWNELCDLISKNPTKIRSLNVDAIIRGGLRRYTDQAGPLWNALADYYVRSALFERARDIYEEGIQSISTVRDFAQIFDAYAQFEELSIKRKMEEVGENPTPEDDIDLELRIARLEHLMTSPQVDAGSRGRADQVVPVGGVEMESRVHPGRWSADREGLVVRVLGDDQRRRVHDLLLLSARGERLGRANLRPVDRDRGRN
ncbi:unnamed protein product [Trichogramma brassicae]|uniref:Reverse transcriptase domain-containing protein n=1 Tax=Trichogramma brassicae TaxID=86971 RepID=A0A6H5J3A8_9HYME|nr:unnamed protein product [Trichogramma brassicae]